MISRKLREFLKELKTRNKNLVFNIDISIVGNKYHVFVLFDYTQLKGLKNDQLFFYGSYPKENNRNEIEIETINNINRWFNLI